MVEVREKNVISELVNSRTTALSSQLSTFQMPLFLQCHFTFQTNIYKDLSILLSKQML